MVCFASQKVGQMDKNEIKTLVTEMIKADKYQVVCQKNADAADSAYKTFYHETRPAVTFDGDTSQVDLWHEISEKLAQFNSVCRTAAQLADSAAFDAQYCVLSALR